jgi:hypothetical protein
MRLPLPLSGEYDAAKMSVNYHGNPQRVTHFNECADHRPGARLLQFLFNGLQANEQFCWQRRLWRKPRPFGRQHVTFFITNDSPEADDLAGIVPGVFGGLHPNSRAVHLTGSQQGPYGLLK